MSAPLPSQAAQQWVNRLTTISRNLMELSEAESTKIIRARLRDAVNGYRGMTREQATRAVEMIDHLLQQYALLAHVVDEAVNLAGKSGIFRNYEARINELLNGPSVVLTQEQVALHERGLLDDEQRITRATPAAVLAQMEQSFVMARDTLATIASAMTNARPHLVALRDEITRLEQWSKTLGVASPPASLDLSQTLSDVERDPLSNAAAVERIAAAIAQWRAELHAVDAERATILASIAQGKAALVALQDLLTRATATLTEVRATLANPEALALPGGDDAMAALNAWLSTLEQNATGGRFAAVKVGMVKWEREYNDRLNAVRASYDHNRALLDERDELRGRFTALSAKADALRRRGVVLGEAMATDSRHTQTVLDATPFDISAARRLVAAFEAAVAAASRS